MNESNLKPFGTLAEDVQRDIRSKGGKARAKKMRERKSIADALRMVLDEPLAKGSRQTRLDGISIKVVKRIFDDPDIRDMKVLAEILGELKQTINSEVKIKEFPKEFTKEQAKDFIASLNK